MTRLLWTERFLYGPHILMIANYLNSSTIGLCYGPLQVMPRSRHRKKPKTKRPKIKVEKIDHGWGEIVRKGKDIFFRNKMTEEQHQQYMQQLRDNRPKAYAEIRQLIDELVGLINKYDKLLVLGSIGSYCYEKMYNQEDDGLSETAMEYLLSIALVTDNKNNGVAPEIDDLHKIVELLNKIRRYFEAYFAVERATGKYSDIEHELRHDMIADALFIRGEGYMSHIKQLYLEMFTPHDAIFQKHYGFSSKDIPETFEKLEEMFSYRIIFPDGKAHPRHQYRVAKWITENRDKVTQESWETSGYLDEMAKDIPEMMIKDRQFGFYPIRAINTSAKLFQIQYFNPVQEKVVRSIALKFGQNTPFIPTKFEYEVLNKSLIYTKPIVEDEEGHHYLFSMNIGARNYFKIAQSLIQQADPKYYQHSFLGNRILIAKDEFIESKVLALFQKMLPGVSFNKGVTYTYHENDLDMKCAKATDGKYELDILGTGNAATYLIEVKAGLISDEAKRGALSSLKTDLSGIIGDAICQSYRAHRFIMHEKRPVFKDVRGQDIPVLNKEKVYRISVSFSYVGGLMASLSKLRQFGVIDEDADFAWAVHIFDLIPFTDLMDSEEMFMDYLDRRIELYRDSRLSSVDEMQLLGLYFDNNLKIRASFKGATHVGLNGYTKEIDKFYDKGGPKPKKKGSVKEVKRGKRRL
ncbi:MAG TPA: hypothetical protein VK483_02520 [Chitinophagaceae bacterium]|nr:hypothetical protein [Chitinophagaceae bacterium]